jgi:ATP-binding cassette subfamily B protein IrtA
MTSKETSLPANPVAFIATLARPHRLLFILSLAAAALSAILALGPLVAVAAMVDAAVSGNATGWKMMTLALLALIATVAHLLLAVGATLGGHKIAFAIQRALRLQLLDHITRAPVSRIEGRAGELKKIALADVDRLEGMLAHILPDMASGLATPLVGAVILAFIDWRLLAAALALLPLAFIAQVWTYRGRGDLFDSWNRTEAQANTAMLSYVRGIATLRAFNRQASTLANVRAAIHALRDLAVTITRKSRYSYSLFSSMLATNLLIILPVALLLHSRGDIDTGDFVLAVTLGAGLVAPLGKVVFATMMAARTGIAIGRIRSVLELPMLPDHGTRPMPDDDTLRFETVGFAYPGGDEVLRHIDLAIEPGTLTAIVGPSGAGKSTLARLLLRLEDPIEGRVTLGGIDMKELPLTALRARFASVFQDSVLFHGTIAENVAMAAPTADEAERLVALDQARATEIGAGISIGDHGARLSGGEKQRVALARALLKQAPVLLLDEATSFIDAVSEKAIQEALAGRGERTIVVIAHWLRSVRHADKIVVLKDGGIEATGTHDELLAGSPTYKALHAAQEKASGWKLGRAPELA